MTEIDLLRSRIHELSIRANQEGFITHTSFMSLSEQAMFYSVLKQEQVSLLSNRYGGVEYVLYGGHEEDDRKMLFFLPYYLTREEFLDGEKNEEYIACLYVAPKNEKYADNLTHRDYLGALMHLGFKREMFGDILTDGTNAYIFVLKPIASQVQEELTKIKHTTVQCKIVPLKECLFKPRYNLVSINVPSLRLDSIIGEVYHLSRRDSQVVIASESVFVNGMLVMNNSHSLKENDRVSIKGKGKFVFIGGGNKSRKGRLFVNVKIYC